MVKSKKYVPAIITIENIVLKVCFVDLLFVIKAYWNRRKLIDFLVIFLDFLKILLSPCVRFLNSRLFYLLYGQVFMKSSYWFKLSFDSLMQTNQQSICSHLCSMRLGLHLWVYVVILKLDLNYHLNHLIIFSRLLVVFEDNNIFLAFLRFVSLLFLLSVAKPNLWKQSHCLA